MKTFKPESHIMLVFVSLWISLLMIGITGCGEDDDNEWVGTWTLETVDGQSIEQMFVEDPAFFEAEIDYSISATGEWTFHSDGMMEAEITMKYEAKGEDIDFSEGGSIRMTGTYSISGSNYTIMPMKIEGTGDFKDLGLEEESVDPSDADTGTWSRKGNTLTLNSDDGVVIVFKKK